ncbi:MAG: homing endonuclease associated repeat-containing protein, partial [Beijerinckiaceae bacterium]
MANVLGDKSEVVDAIREVARQLGRAPSRAEFKASAKMSEHRILKHFPSWREAVRAAGLDPNSTNMRLDDSVLLRDWGDLVRKHRHIPTRDQYRKEGKFSPGAFEKHFG